MELCSLYPREVCSPYRYDREVIWGPSPHGYSDRWCGTLVLRVPLGEGTGGGQDVVVPVCSGEMM